MQTAVDPVIQSTIMSGYSGEAIAASSMRTRSMDAFQMGVTGVWTNALVAPTVFAAQGIRMLNGTPGQFANAVGPTSG